jgi:phosphoglycerate kinase
MAYTFLKAQGIAIGDSLCEEAALEMARAFLKKAPALHLPQDFVIASQFSNDAPAKVVSAKEGIPAGWQGMDIGPQTIQDWSQKLSSAKMVFWNGPVGVFEFPKFAQGTQAIAKRLAQLDATTIVGGGDSVAAISELNLQNKFTHVSTGGGAALEYIEFGRLPGIDALANAN